MVFGHGEAGVDTVGFPICLLIFIENRLVLTNELQPNNNRKYKN